MGVSNGTDALRLSLEAAGVGPGDDVVVPSFTFIATATAVSALAARPVFADVDAKTLTITAETVRKVLTRKTKAIIPVHLFGQPVDMDPLLALAKEKNLAIIEDCAQAHLTAYKGRTVGTIGDYGAFSFYPSKNMGAAGDAGGVVTQDEQKAEAIRQLRNCGRVTGGPAYQHARVGHNCRLDEFQAAVLRVKLKHLKDWTAGRRAVAARYIEGLKGLPLRLPELGSNGNAHSFHLFVIRTENRDALAKHLTERGIGNAVYYPIPIHQQPAYEKLAPKVGSLPVTEEACKTALALPMFPELETGEVDAACQAVRDFFKK
jgi:dTDP-4-amino-4,6-dideoxygalactose transaminase